jgi:N-terminal domain of toast_rack, DUF2154
LPKYPVQAALAAAALALCAASCVVVTDNERATEHASQTVDLKGAQSVQVNVEMGAGQLEMHGGAAALMDADFRYNSGLRPEVKYDVTGTQGTLEVRQPSHRGIHGNKNTWDLRLNEEVPMNIKVHMGAGEGRLSLGALTLHSVQVEMGAGELKLDLTGHPRNDMDVSIHGGVGSATVRLPKRARLEVEAHGGLGEINVRGMTKQGDRWVNEPSGEAPTMRVNVTGGIGQINVTCE